MAMQPKIASPSALAMRKCTPNRPGEPGEKRKTMKIYNITTDGCGQSIEANSRDEAAITFAEDEFPNAAICGATDLVDYVEKRGGWCYITECD